MAQDLREVLIDSTRNNLERYLAHCKRMGYEIDQQNGIIIYGFGRIEEGIPADVYFLPCNFEGNKITDEYIENKLSDKNNVFYEIMLPPLRWQIPNLAEVVDSLDYKNLDIENKRSIAKIGYCHIVFNKFFGNTKSTYPSNPTISEVKVNFKGLNFNISVQELPDDKGYPVYLNKLN